MDTIPPQIIIKLLLCVEFRGIPSFPSGSQWLSSNHSVAFNYFISSIFCKIPVSNKSAVCNSSGCDCDLPVIVNLGFVLSKGINSLFHCESSNYLYFSLFFFFAKTALLWNNLFNIRSNLSYISAMYWPLQGAENNYKAHHKKYFWNSQCTILQQCTKIVW